MDELDSLISALSTADPIVLQVFKVVVKERDRLRLLVNQQQQVIDSLKQVIRSESADKLRILSQLYPCC